MHLLNVTTVVDATLTPLGWKRLDNALARWVNRFHWQLYLSVHNVSVPAEARHHPGHSVRVSQHVGDGHLVELGVPEGDDGSTTGTVAPLVVVVVNEDESVAAGHETPTLSPVPADKNHSKPFHVKTLCLNKMDSNYAMRWVTSLHILIWNMIQPQEQKHTYLV